MTPKPNVRKIDILAVDDIPANLVALEAVLGSEYNVVTATSGAEALEILAKPNNVGVILMDLQMPKMDGFEAATQIKKLENCRDIPIIFITAIYKEEPFVRKGYEIGAVDYFSKPFDPEILRMKVAVYAAFHEKHDLLKERERHIHASEELLKAGRKLSSILESLQVGVIIADTEGRVCQTNEVVSRIFKSVDVIESDAYGEVLGWWDESGQMIKEGPLARALNGEPSHNEVIQIRCLDGSAKTILGSASPLRGLDSQIVGAVVVIQDVTETKKIEADLEQRITKLVTLGVEFEQSASARSP